MRGPAARRPLAVAGLVVGTLLVLAGPAAAHARLIASTPAGGATVTESPPLVRLDFDERIESSFGGVQVFDPSGARVAEQAPPSIHGRTVELPLTPIDSAGTYTVVFRVISADGHPIEARYSFIFQPPAPTTTTTDRSASVPSSTVLPQVDPADIELESAGPGTRAGLRAARAGNYLALTLIIGLLLAAGLFLPAGGGEHPAARRASRAAAIAAAVWAATALALFAFALSDAAARPIPEVLSSELIARFAGTRFGTLLLAQAVIACVVGALTAASRVVPVLVKVALAAAALGAAAPALWGHAGTDDLPLVAVTNDWAHVLGATAWVGGLAALTGLLFVGEHGPVGPPALRFSRLAGWALGIVAATGVVNTLLHLGDLGQLTSTGWGKLALLKAGLIIVIAGVGYRTRRRVLPRLSDGGDGDGRRAFARLARFELLLMVCAFGVATQMASGVTADADAASRVQSIAVAMGEGRLNVTVAPGRTGSNVIHVYVLDANGLVDPTADDASMTVQQGTTEMESRLLASGPGHWSALDQRIPTRGEWIIRVAVTTSRGPASASGAVIIR